MPDRDISVAPFLNQIEGGQKGVCWLRCRAREVARVEAMLPQTPNRATRRQASTSALPLKPQALITCRPACERNANMSWGDGILLTKIENQVMSAERLLQPWRCSIR